MFNNSKEFIDAICSRRKSERAGVGLENIKKATSALGNPQQQLRCLHVAGTNGKGSTTNYLRSILQETGYKVGTFTSPHLISHHDRIRINNIPIDDKTLLRYGNEDYDFYLKYDLSMFEIDMLLSIRYFLEEKVDFAIYEVGLGGKYDSTNIITPLISIITNISLDHTSYLGNTYEEIAYEKAGIIKPHIPIMTMEQKPECLKVFKEVANTNRSELIALTKPLTKVNEGILSFYSDNHGWLSLATIAQYQTDNAALAVSAIDYLSNKGIVNVDKEIISKGLKTQWQGRFEIMRTEPLVIIDGAHNQAGIEVLIESMATLPKPICVVFSALKDKDYPLMIEKLLVNCDELVITQFDFYRAALAKEMAASLPVTVIEDYREAIKYAQNKYSNGTVIICGSLYFISDVRNDLLKNII